jgi:hypothetical protein
VTASRTLGFRRGFAASFGLALLVSAASTPLAAQLIPVPMSDEVSRPIAVSASAGYFLTQNRFDGQSGQPWYLGDGWQYRVGADVSLDIGSLGVAATFATVPIQRGNVTTAIGEIQQRQILGTFRSPEPEGFGQVIELGVGLSQWLNYSGSGTLSADDLKARNALALVLGYGLSIPLGKRATVTLAQDYATVIGSGEGLPPGTRRAQEQYTTRIGLRWRVIGARE